MRQEARQAKTITADEKAETTPAYWSHIKTTAWKIVVTFIAGLHDQNTGDQAKALSIWKYTSSEWRYSQWCWLLGSVRQFSWNPQMNPLLFNCVYLFWLPARRCFAIPFPWPHTKSKFKRTMDLSPIIYQSVSWSDRILLCPVNRHFWNHVVNHSPIRYLLHLRSFFYSARVWASSDRYRSVGTLRAVTSHALRARLIVNSYRCEHLQ